MLVEENRPAASSAARDGWALAVCLWFLIPVVLFVVLFLQTFESFSAVGCEGACDLEFSFAVRAAFPWEVAASVAAAIVIALLLKSRGKPTFWAPLVGIILVLTAAILTSILFQSGLTGMRERNDRIARGEIPAAPAPPPPDPAGAWGTRAVGSPNLQFSADGTFAGSDGCNDLSGSWTQDSAGTITLDARVETARLCADVDDWLNQGRSAFIVDDFLYINGTTGSPIGGLAPAG